MIVGFIFRELEACLEGLDKYKDMYQSHDVYVDHAIQVCKDNMFILKFEIK